MKKRGLDKNENIREIEIEQEYFEIGKSLQEVVEGKTDVNKKDYIRGIKRYFIDGMMVTKEEAEGLFEEIKNIDPHWKEFKQKTGI